MNLVVTSLASMGAGVSATNKPQDAVAASSATIDSAPATETGMVELDLSPRHPFDRHIDIFTRRLESLNCYTN